MQSAELDLRVWARREIRNRRRARTLRRLNMVLIPVCCVVFAWVVWHVL